MKVGFIGLGNMGRHMATNLAKAGYEVAGFDIATACPEELVQANSSVAAAEDSDVVITMLPDGDSLRSVASEIIPAMSNGTVLLDCSTVDIASAQATANDSDSAGIHFVDAPVSGGVAGAENATLTFMAGGTGAAFDIVQPLLKAMGARSVHCGPAGSGQAAKICNNMILGATMIVTCEAFGLADRLGLSREKMFEVVSSSSGFSWSLNKYCPAPNVGPTAPSDNDFRPGFAADLMLKDLRLSQQAASASGAETPIGRHATEIYRSFVEEENGSGLDFSAIITKFTAT